MTLQEQIEREKGNLDRVFLTAEGLFYKAYERSAYILCTQYQMLKPTLKRVKYLGGEMVVSVGFPQTSLPRLAAVLPACPSDSDPVFQAVTPITEEDFRVWKSSISLQTDNSLPADVSPVQELVRVIQRFPLESSTPVSCLMFVSDLKKMVSGISDN